jgi:hypothetical protein
MGEDGKLIAEDEEDSSMPTVDPIVPEAMYAIVGTAKKYGFKEILESDVLTLRLGTDLVARWRQDTSTNIVGRPRVFHMSAFENSADTCMPDEVTPLDKERYLAWVMGGSKQG